MLYKKIKSCKVIRLLRFSGFILISFCLFGLSAQETNTAHSEFIVAPYLQDVSDSSFCVMWETSVPLRGQVLLARSERHILKPELKLAVEESESVFLHKLTIENLKSGELYFYQVVNENSTGDTLMGPVTQLVIPDYDQSAINFTVVGDNQGHVECWERISQLMFEECPQFVVHVGDMVSYGHHKDDWTDEFFLQARELMRHVPMYPAMGNHEMNDEKYYQYFNRPYNDAFYTVKKGDLRIVFVDTNKDLLPGSYRYRRLEETLANCKERWTIVVHHHPVFTSDIGSYRSSLMATADKGDPNIFQLKQLYETYGVDLVLSGHVHGYERSYPIAKNHIDEKNGVVYIISAGGGGSCNPPSSYKEWFTQKTRKRMHYLNVQITGNKMTVEAIDNSLITFDKWELIKNEECKINAPLISFSPRYFEDSTTVTIQNTNATGTLNYKLNDGRYQTSFDKSVSFTLENTTTVSALASQKSQSSREMVKAAIKLPLIEKQSSSKKNIIAGYYEGFFTTLPDFQKLKPSKVFQLDSLSLDGITPRSKDHFAVCFTGTIKVPETAVYRFFLESFDGSALFVDGNKVIENDGVHYEIFEEGYAALEKGNHNIEVQYFDFERRETLRLQIGKQDGEMYDINHFLQNR